MQKIIFILNLKCQVSMIAIKNKHCLNAIYLNSFLPHEVNNLTFQLRHNGSYSTRCWMKTSTLNSFES